MSISKIIVSIIIIITALYMISCASGRYLRTEPTETFGIEGTYILMLHGGRYSDDIENVAIFDKESDQYIFEIAGREDNYTVIKNISAKEAIEKAQKFVRFHRSFWRSRLSSIIDPNGNVIGYELRPLYQIFEFGDQDVLSVNYSITDSRVLVHIWTRQDLEHKEPFLFRRKFHE